MSAGQSASREVEAGGLGVAGGGGRPAGQAAAPPAAVGQDAKLNA